MDDQSKEGKEAVRQEKIDQKLEHDKVERDKKDTATKTPDDWAML